MHLNKKFLYSSYFEISMNWQISWFDMIVANIATPRRKFMRKIYSHLPICEGQSSCLEYYNDIHSNHWKRDTYPNSWDKLCWENVITSV